MSVIVISNKAVFRASNRHGARSGLMLITAFVFQFLVHSVAHSVDLMWGVNGHPFSAYPGVPFSQQLDLVRELGATSYRVNVSTIDQVAPLADLVALGRNRGLTILPILTPAIDIEREKSDVIYARAFNFAATIAARFRNDIRVWELGNELENYAILQPCEVQDDGIVYPCSNGPAGGVTATEYVSNRWAKVSALLKGLSDGVLSVDRQMLKAMGTAGWGHFGAFDRMRQDGIAWDITVWHAYREESEEVFQRLAGFGKPIWITELNHPRGSEESAAAQAAGLRPIMRGLRSYRERYKIEAAFLYELLDEPYWSGSFEALMGLVTQTKRQDGAWSPAERKPAFEVVRQTIKAGGEPTRANCDLNRKVAAEVTAATKVNYLYCLVLGRDADGQGLADYSARLSKDLTVQALAVDLLSTEEFTNFHAPASLTDAEYVKFVHRLFGDTAASDLTAESDRLHRGTTDRRSLILEVLHQPGFSARHPILFAPVRHTSTNGTIQ